MISFSFYIYKLSFLVISVLNKQPSRDTQCFEYFYAITKFFFLRACEIPRSVSKTVNNLFHYGLHLRPKKRELSRLRSEHESERERERKNVSRLLLLLHRSPSYAYAYAYADADADVQRNSPPTARKKVFTLKITGNFGIDKC